MVDKTETKKVESELNESKKLDDFKNSDENMEAVAKDGGKIVESKTDKKVEDVKVDKKEDKNKDKKADKKSEVHPTGVPLGVASSGKKALDGARPIELEREYVIPLKRSVLKAPQYRRAKKAIKTIREFLAKHMRVEDRDLRKIKIDRYLNNEVWFRGIKKPANKIKVRAVKKGGIVYVELAEIPEAVKFVMARDKRKLEALEDAKKSKAPKTEEKPVDKDNDGVADTVSEKENKKAGAEKEAKTQKAAVKTEKHTTKGAHAKKTMPVRKTLK